MKDERPLRQIIIDRIKAYVNGLEFYAPELVAEHQYDFDSMTDVELVRTFEQLVFNNHKVRKAYRERDPHGMFSERRR